MNAFTLDPVPCTLDPIMKSFPAAFTTEISQKTGITPVWILRLTVDGTIYDLSDSVITFPGGIANGFTTTLPWIARWGEVRESISGQIGEMLISDFSCTVLVDQDITNNIRHLALNHPLEQSAAELYLWLDGLTAATPPQRMFVGYVKDIDVPDETQVHLTIEDESTRLQKYIGTRISSESFPLCDPDDVGKLIPIVYGSVSKLPALCVDSGWVTALTVGLDYNATSMTVSELPAYTVVGKHVTIEEEQILITAATGKVLTIVRAQNATTAVNHFEGTTVIEKKTTPLVYLLADHALDSIGNIYARVKNIDIDITTDCTKYLGTTGNQLAAYPGRAAVTIPNFAQVSNRINLQIADTIKLTDSGHSHTTASTTTGSVTQNASPLPSQFAQIKVHSFSEYLLPPGGILEFMVGRLDFPAVSGIYECSLTVQFASSSFRNWVICAADSSDLSKYVEIYGWASKPTSSVITLTLDATQRKYNTLIFFQYIFNAGSTYMDVGQYFMPVQVTVCNRTYKAYVGGSGTTQSGAAVTKSGTVTLSGNSVADVMVGDMILVDVTRSSITTPSDVIDDLLSTYCSDSTLTTVGTFPANYALNGAITEYKKAIEWLDYLSFQSGAFYRKICGVSRLIVRVTDPAVTGTIAACCLTDEGIKALSFKKAPVSDVINKVKVLYNRDWSNKGKQSEAYQNAIAVTDDASIAIFSEQEQPEMFMFDFVTGSAMANALATFYCDFYADRKWRISFSTFLDQAQYEFGDVVTLGFYNDLTGIVIEAGIAPGDLNTIDKMNFVVEAAIIPEVAANGMTTLLGDQIHTKSQEAVTYV